MQKTECFTIENLLCLQTRHLLCQQTRHVLCQQKRHLLCQLISPKTSPRQSPNRGGRFAAAPVWRLWRGCLGRCLLTQQMSYLLTYHMSCILTTDVLSAVITDVLSADTADVLSAYTSNPQIPGARRLPSTAVTIKWEQK